MSIDGGGRRRGSYRVALVDRLDVEPLELDHRLDVSFERVQLPEPGHLGALGGLLGDLGQLAVARVVVEEVGVVAGLVQPVQRPLRRRPLRLPLHLAVVALIRERRLFMQSTEVR